MVDDVKYWYTNDGQISLSNERFKHGKQSLKWEWSSTSTLTYTNPESFKTIKWANNKCLAFWLFSDQQPTNDDDNNPSKPISIEFLTATDSQPVAHIWYHVNFYGWRPMGLRYALLPEFKANLSRIHGIRIYPPSNLSQGVFYINGLNFDYTHNIGPKADYQQPWATQENIKRLDDDPTNWLFNPNNIFHNRSWLTEQQINANEDDVNKIRQRWIDNLPYGTWSPSTKAEPFSKLQEAADKYGVRLDTISNISLGKNGFYSVSDALDIQPFLLGPLKRTATSFQCHRHRKTVDSEEGQKIWKLLLQLCDYLLEQGWAEGNMNIEGHLDIGYEIRNFPMCLIYIRDSLNEVNRLQPMLLSAIWIMYGHLLIEQYTSTLNTDIIHNYLTCVSRLIVCLPDQDELIRRLTTFRYLLTYCFENRIHEPIALDGTVHHHWMCHFEYASYSLLDALKFIADLNDTEFRFSNNIHRIFRRCVYTLNFCLIENDKIPPNLNARAGKCICCNGINITKTCTCMDDPYDRYAAGMLVSMCSKSDKCISKYLEDNVEPVEFEGHLTLNSTAASIHRRSNFYACIVGMGKNRRGLEIYGWLPDSNNYGQYARNCSIFLTRVDEQGSLKYSNAGCAYPGWQWSHWPGTTCLLKSRSELFEGYSNLTAKNWLAGGTSIDKRDGMFSNDFFVWDVAFRRSIYCFNNRLTVLTTNIRLLEQKRRPVITTLFQSNFNELNQVVLTLNNHHQITEFPYEQTFDVNQLESIIDHRKLTYYLHPRENENQSYQIKIRYGEQEMIYCNQSYLIDPKNNPIIDMKSKQFREDNFEDNEKYFRPTKDQFGLGYIEHLQVDDGTSSFVYTILIDQDNLEQWIGEHSYEDKDPWSNTDLSRLPPTIILKKTDDQHIFYDRETDTTCYTCYSKEGLNVDIGLVQSFGEPCFAMVRGRGPGTIKISIATTDFMLNETMWIMLKGQWDNAQLISDDENGCVYIRSEILDNGATKVTVWQRIYMPIEFQITQV